MWISGRGWNFKGFPNPQLPFYFYSSSDRKEDSLLHVYLLVLVVLKRWWCILPVCFLQFPIFLISQQLLKLFFSEPTKNYIKAGKDREWDEEGKGPGSALPWRYYPSPSTVVVVKCCETLSCMCHYHFKRENWDIFIYTCIHSISHLFVCKDVHLLYLS